MTYSLLHGSVPATCTPALPVLSSNVQPRPGATERHLLSVTARYPEGLSFDTLSASIPSDAGRDALRDAVLECLDNTWLSGTFECLRCTKAGAAFTQADGQALTADSPDATRDGLHDSGDKPQPVRKGILRVSEGIAVSATRHVRWADGSSLPLTRVHWTVLDESPTTEANPEEFESPAAQVTPEEPDAHLDIKKQLRQLAGIDFGDPPLGRARARAKSGHVSDKYGGHSIAHRCSLAWKCLFSSSYRDVRAISKHMGKLLGALSRPVKLLPVSDRVPAHWPPVSRAHLQFIGADEKAYAAEKRAVWAAAVPPDEMSMPSPMSLCIPALAGHIGRLNEADLRVLLGGIKRESMRLSGYKQVASTREAPVAKGNDGDAARPEKVMMLGDPARYAKLLSVVKNMALDALERTATESGPYG